MNLSPTKILSLLDYTTLSILDTEAQLLTMQNKLQQLGNATPAAICVYPNFVKAAKNIFKTLPIACVAGGFPDSQTFTEVKVLEAKLAVEQGAQEVDIVLPVGKFSEGKDEEIIEEIANIQAVIGTAKLKLILETGLLPSPVEIRHAAQLGLLAGVDFLKSSTGKNGAGASLEATRILAQEIKKHRDLTGKTVGLKLSGGVSSVEFAQKLITEVAHILGEDFIRPAYFRIGTSKLIDQLIAQTN